MQTLEWPFRKRDTERVRKNSWSSILALENEDVEFSTNGNSSQKTSIGKQSNKYKEIYIDVKSKFVPKYWDVNVCKITCMNGLRKMNVGFLWFWRRSWNLMLLMM